MMTDKMTDEQRAEAWCPKHNRIEPVTSLLSTDALKGVANGITASVIVECGKRFAIITSPPNVVAMRA